jgi:hypothetical protein
MYILINYNSAVIHDQSNSDKFFTMLSNLNKGRNKYLSKRNLTVMDDSPFKHFTFTCKGESMDPKRINFLKREEKLKKRIKLSFIYNPTSEKQKVPNFNFENSSGNRIVANNILTIK